MIPVKDSEYLYQRKQALLMLAKLKEKITAAKNNGKISIDKIRENEKASDSLFEFIKMADLYILQLIQTSENENKIEFNTVYENDRNDVLKEKKPSKYFNKEAFRASHELAVKNKWSALY